MVCVHSCVCQPETHNGSNPNDQVAQTMTFIAWMVGHVLLGNSMRSLTQPLYFVKPVRLSLLLSLSVFFVIDLFVSHLTVVFAQLFSNPLMVIWTISAWSITLILVLIPGLHDALQFARMDINYLSGYGGDIARGAGWGVALAFPVFMLLVLEAKKWFRMGLACADTQKHAKSVSREQVLFPSVNTQAAFPSLPTASAALPLAAPAPAKTVTFHIGVDQPQIV